MFPTFFGPSQYFMWIGFNFLKTFVARVKQTLDPHVTTYHSSILVQIIVVFDLSTSTSKGLHLPKLIGPRNCNGSEPKLDIMKIIYYFPKINKKGVRWSSRNVNLVPPCTHKNLASRQCPSEDRQLIPILKSQPLTLPWVVGWLHLQVMVTPNMGGTPNMPQPSTLQCWIGQDGIRTSPYVSKHALPMAQSNGLDQSLTTHKITSFGEPLHTHKYDKI